MRRGLSLDGGRGLGGGVALLLACWLAGWAAGAEEEPAEAFPQAPDLLEELKQVPRKIVFESLRDGNWELCAANADGTAPVRLTRTPGAAWSGNC